MRGMSETTSCGFGLAMKQRANLISGKNCTARCSSHCGTSGCFARSRSIPSGTRSRGQTELTLRQKFSIALSAHGEAGAPADHGDWVLPVGERGPSPAAVDDIQFEV